MKDPLNVLVACESSGTVRDAFTRLGHRAVSCDLLPCDVPGEHIVGDARDHLGAGWDLLIAHPPCTYLSSSGMHWTTRGLRDPKLTEDALELVRAFMDAPIPRICIENPVGVVSTRIRKPDQIVQPWQFGDDASKRTCLWLKGVPPLVPDPANYFRPRLVNNRQRWGNQTDSGQNRLGPSELRWQLQSKTYQGIADAMAQAWGGDSGWRRVSYAGDIPAGTDECQVCGGDYADCPCPGPTQDEFDYQDFHGVMFARRTNA